MTPQAFPKAVVRVSEVFIVDFSIAGASLERTVDERIFEMAPWSSAHGDLRAISIVVRARPRGRHMRSAICARRQTARPRSAICKWLLSAYIRRIAICWVSSACDLLARMKDGAGQIACFEM